MMVPKLLPTVIVSTVLFVPAIVVTQSPSSRGGSAQPTAAELLAASDRVRNPDQPFRVTLALVEYINNKPRDRTGLIVYSREDKQTKQFNNLVRYAQPPRDAGKLVLLKGSNLWFYDPASKA